MHIWLEHIIVVFDLSNHDISHNSVVACNASIRSIAQYSAEVLSIRHDKGLWDLYIGFETGSDEVLKLMNKGHTVSDAISQAKKLNEADLSFNTIVIYGIGGQGRSVENAVATAEMIMQFRTRRIITMNLTVFPGTKLKQMIESGDFIAAPNRERLIEVKTLLENLDPTTPTVFDTTHPTNILKIKGMLPQYKERLLAEVRKRLH